MQIAEVLEREFVHFARLTGMRRPLSHHRYKMVGCSAGDSKIITETTRQRRPRDFVYNFRWREKTNGERKLSCSPSSIPLRHPERKLLESKDLREAMLLLFILDPRSLPTRLFPFPRGKGLGVRLLRTRHPNRNHQQRTLPLRVRLKKFRRVVVIEGEPRRAAAKRVCRACEAIEPCLEFALATNQESGVWGGASEEERRKLRKAWLAARRRAS